MPKLNILITCIGGFFMVDTIEALRLDRDLNVRIIGTDANPEVTSRFFVDAFHLVPSASRAPEEFVAALRGICTRESVQLVIPGADEEVLALSRAKKAFDDIGVVCAVEDSCKVELMRDKFRLFGHLAEEGISMPKFAEVSRIEDIARAADQLGYPDSRFVLKPKTGRGSRGLIVVDSRLLRITTLSEARGYRTGNLESVIEWLQQETDSLELMAMEYLPGPAFDVDCVARNGVPLCVVVRRRLWKDPFSPMSQGCRIERHERLEHVTRQIVEVLSLNYIFDFDFGSTEDGVPGLFELNPRWSGAVAAALAGDVNIPNFLVRSMSGLPVPTVELKIGARMFPVTRMFLMDL